MSRVIESRANTARREAPLIKGHIRSQALPLHSPLSIPCRSSLCSRFTSSVLLYFPFRLNKARTDRSRWDSCFLLIVFRHARFVRRRLLSQIKSIVRHVSSSYRQDTSYWLRWFCSRVVRIRRSRVVKIRWFRNKWLVTSCNIWTFFTANVACIQDASPFNPGHLNIFSVILLYRLYNI